MIRVEHQVTPAFPQTELAAYQEAHLGVLHQVQATDAKVSPHHADLGWFDPNQWAGDGQVAELKQLAKTVQTTAGVLVVVGVGGSNQAARAVLEALPHPACEIVYAGTNLSANAYQRLLARLKDREVTINVIAKNFQTLEPGIGFRVFKPFLQAKYGAAYARHLIVTGTKGSAFEALATAQGYPFLPFPDDIGGRFSALSPVGLFPLAVAGIDIAAMVQGAKTERAALLADATATNPAWRYASFRQFLLRHGTKLEVLAHFEPQLDYFGRWWTQLFAESEGKQDDGLYPVALTYSEDLHSVGQYIQQGQKDLAETFLVVAQPSGSLAIQASGVADGFGYLNGRDLTAINRTAEQATIAAHRDSGVPVTLVYVPTVDPATFGALFYFFEFAVYLSGTLIGVDPFDQPGVEAYKTLMFAGLGRGEA